MQEDNFPLTYAVYADSSSHPGCCRFRCLRIWKTVEAQFEDVPGDLKCHTDNDGNTYDFAFGLNWSGVIKDNRTAKYDVPPIVGGP